MSKAAFCRFYRRKLYALLQLPPHSLAITSWLGDLACFKENGTDLIPQLEQWWSENGAFVQDLASSSDRVNLWAAHNNSEEIPIRHPISGQSGTVAELPSTLELPDEILQEPDVEKVFWWFWRFYPERWLNSQAESDGLLYPAHPVLPDCPLHSYQATVSALAGTLFPEDWQDGSKPQHPYLLIFTFSPIQDFIKASRKFLDFWAGSYLLHYLSARLCWHIARSYGPDALIVPSLWGQDIIDAFLLERYKNDAAFTEFLVQSFQEIGDRKTPVQHFSDRTSTSLSTAGFPNVITALVPGKENAMTLGNELADTLKEEWKTIGEKVCEDIQCRVSQEAKEVLEKYWTEFWKDIREGLPNSENEAPYKRDLEKWRSQHDQHGNPTCPNWEWKQLWHTQLENTWEPYWAAIPLGDPTFELTISKENNTFSQAWKDAQSNLSFAWESSSQPIPNLAEEHAFSQLNVGTWWGSFQQRLRLAIQTVKTTRNWNIPIAPGERSTISGQYSAVHPNLNYRIVQRNGETLDFREGGGLPEGSMRLFWLLMSRAYPGLFNGSERLNALELTKRMGWIYGDVAESLGIQVNQTVKRIPKHRRLLDKVQQSWQVQHLEQLLYDRFVRFPNLSSIAAARFIHDYPDAARKYYQDLEQAIAVQFGSKHKKLFQHIARRRPSQIPKTDQHVKSTAKAHQCLNGVMFSSKWLAEDLNLDKASPDQNPEHSDVAKLRRAVADAHQAAGFGEGSPSDWWAVVLADGDGMGQYISGSRLETYDKYLVNVDASSFTKEVEDAYRILQTETKKRMGPATHVGLNRALLDFSNRLVPYLTEKRFCGKVIYSGGDDVMAVLPLEDLPGYLRSLRAAWSGTVDPYGEFEDEGGYWKSKTPLEGVPPRPLFTMGQGATMSIGVVIAYKTVPLPTVLENLWEAEGDRAKAMAGKDGICFRVIYGGGNTLEALMKGCLLDDWWAIAQQFKDTNGNAQDALSPLLYRLAEVLPHRVEVSHPDLFAIAAQVIMHRRDEDRKIAAIEEPIKKWLDVWATWANETSTSEQGKDTPGATSEDLGRLLRFTAFWVDKMVQRETWKQPSAVAMSRQPNGATGG